MVIHSHRNHWDRFSGDFSSLKDKNSPKSANIKENKPEKDAAGKLTQSSPIFSKGAQRLFKAHDDSPRRPIVRVNRQHCSYLSLPDAVVTVCLSFSSSSPVILVSLSRFSSTHEGEPSCVFASESWCAPDMASLARPKVLRSSVDLYCRLRILMKKLHNTNFHFNKISLSWCSMWNISRKLVQILWSVMNN